MGDFYRIIDLYSSFLHNILLLLGAKQCYKTGSSQYYYLYRTGDNEQNVLKIQKWLSYLKDTNELTQFGIFQWGNILQLS